MKGKRFSIKEHCQSTVPSYPNIKQSYGLRNRQAQGCASPERKKISTLTAALRKLTAKQNAPALFTGSHSSGSIFFLPPLHLSLRPVCMGIMFKYSFRCRIGGWWLLGGVCPSSSFSVCFSRLGGVHEYSVQVGRWQLAISELPF